MYDILIQNGLIVDGSGKKAYPSDLAVKDGKIVRIAQKIDEPAAQVIDAAGFQITPGFIDTHTHSDNSVFFGSGSENYLLQGVTLQICGQCGSSPAPVHPRTLESQRNSLPKEKLESYLENAKTLPGFMEKACSQSYGTNYAFLIGHSAIRGSVMNFSKERPAPVELGRMKSIAKEAMECGYFGMSTGLVYAPSVYAETEELIELAREIQPYGGYYASHIRGEGVSVLKSVKEAIRIGEEAGVPVCISHLKVLGKQNEGMSERLLQEIDEANARGVSVFADQYPFTASSANLYTQVHPKYLVGGKDQLLKRLEDPSIRKEILYDMFHDLESFESSLYSAGFDGTFVTSAGVTKDVVGLSLAEIARKRQKDPFDVFCDLIMENRCVISGIYHNQNATDLLRIMQHPRVFCGSDSSDHAMPDDEKRAGGHPRGTATMVRRLELVRDFNLRSMEESVKNLTLDPATAAGIPDQGLILEGRDANLCIFDYENLHTRANYSHAYRKSEGIHCVVVNGKIAVQDGKITGVRNGKVLQKKTR